MKEAHVGFDIFIEDCDGIDTFACYLMEGEHWNGWMEPFMTKEQLDVFIPIQQRTFGDDMQLSFGATGKSGLPDLLCTDACYPDEPSRITPTYNKEVGQHLYDVSFGLCWSDYTVSRKIAERFIYHLKEEIGYDNYRLAALRNRKEVDANVCHTHDFCDANMEMLAAFNDCEEDADDMNMWNEAWIVAKGIMRTEATSLRIAYMSREEVAHLDDLLADWMIQYVELQKDRDVLTENDYDRLYNEYLENLQNLIF